MKKLYLVSKITKHLSISADLLTSDKPLLVGMNWLAGQVGVCPVFNNHKKALIYAQGDLNRILAITIREDDYEKRSMETLH